MIVFPKEMRVFFSQQRKVITEGNVKNMEIQDEIRPRVHCGKKEKQETLRTDIYR